MGYTISWNPLDFTEYSYNCVIRVLPKVLNTATTFKLEDWGFTIGTINESVSFNKNGHTHPWITTDQLPYIKEVLKALILMVEYGATENINYHDISYVIFREVLKEVNLKHPLRSYNIQKIKN